MFFNSTRFDMRGLHSRLCDVEAAARQSMLIIGIFVLGTEIAAGQVASGPMVAHPSLVLPTPRDQSFTGAIDLAVNATDLDHQVYAVHETIPVQKPGDMVLLYPEWESASHAPTASVVELAGLMVHVDGAPSDWLRDPLDMHAFHINVPKGARSVAVDFQFLPSSSEGLLRADMIEIQWQRLLLYPAGWYVRDIPVMSKLIMPRGLTPFTALPLLSQHDGVADFQTVPLDQLVDAPVYAGRYDRQIALNHDKSNPVYMDLVADDQNDLAIDEDEIARTKALIAQALKVFGTPPYRHYDAIVTLSDVLAPNQGGGGIEHAEEGENNLPGAYFTNPAGQLNNRDLTAHEFVHAWNGRWRQPVDLWSPTFNQPVEGSLLWVYEGQTEFWGRVLAARAGLRNRQQTLDKIALDAAIVANRAARRWKNLRDSTNDAIYMSKHHVGWRDWQRREDYYPEGVLLWLDVDARLRELSHGARSMDDFARIFFVKNSNQSTSTYTFQDVCDTLGKLAPDDWAGFLNRHLDTHNTDEAIAGLARAGWKLVYTDTPTETFRQDEQETDAIHLSDSVGLEVDPDGNVQSVQWDSPAFRAGLSPGARVLDVNGQPFSTTSLLSAVRSSLTVPINLRAVIQKKKRVISIDYRGGLRYPHLERIAGTPDGLSDLLSAR